MCDYEDSLCCMEAEQDIIWTDDYLYKKERFPKERLLEPAPDISHLHKDNWMFDYIPF